MSAKGRGNRPHVQQRRDRILAALAASTAPMTTKEVAEAVGSHYGPVYADLRTMSGSHTLSYRQCDDMGDVNVPGYPVIWHNWFSQISGESSVAWSLAPDERERYESETALLEALFATPAQEEADDG